MSEVEVTALPRPRTEFDTALSIGVEEEFLLVDADTGALVPLAGEVLGDADGVLDLQAEITRYQVESATSVCLNMAEVRDDLLLSRRTLRDLARVHGARVVATGTPVLAGGRPPPLTDRERYRDIARRYGSLVDVLTICGCHVHVGIPDEETGVLISNHLRQWLPVLLAISANSPFSEGRDTGYASWRYLSWSPWPSAGAPPWFASPEDYHLNARALRMSGAAMDAGMIYWDVRLSANHPTVELRVCDVAATVAEAVLIAALTRAIAATAVTGRPALPVSDLVLRTGLWRAARDGVEGAALEPRTGRLVPAADRVRALVEWTRPALRASGDEDLVDEGVARLLVDGCGATRQRRAFQRRGSLADVVDMLAEQT
ncbi:carboxylate-amine ligase [Saccharothrix australiensis]|uniref:Putative glutamate--cysteine ligase 2 n=1 Tax=Saccharothrix australiensis TaxID=2072 RepID=A0A495W3M6_9PSEU|nr:glutamate--cysteine ligase [Saccharothrix australiensis]RKT56321.1 carboxylate-amine ligase [Saccharothrix australiensis]